MSEKHSKVSRRDLLKSATLAGVGLAGLSGPSLGGSNSEPQSRARTVLGMKFQPLQTVRLAVVGCGARGSGMLSEFLAVDGVQITAVCDIVKEKVDQARLVVERAGQKTPATFSNGERDFERLCRRDDIDFVYIATPWDWHVPMALAAMNNGKHAGLEVPAAISVAECWQLVETSEKTRRHCVIMENCCYGYNEMLVLNMVRAGQFGDLLHGEAAYLHDLRSLLFSDSSEGLWRRFPHMTRDGNLYPTHGLGPVAHYLNIHRGDRFDYLVSMSSPQLGLDQWRLGNVAKDSPKWKEKYKCGDVNTSLIKTTRGRTIMLQHNVTSARPYDRLNSLQGTKGIFQDYPPRIFFDGQEGGEKWATIDKFKSQYEDALWKNIGELARRRGGHGGMDFVMCYRLIQCMREGLAPDMDVYDAAAWSVPGPLSEMSVAQGSAPVKFPDFTRGHWRDARAQQS